MQCKWDAHWLEVNIAAKELLSIVLACAEWGRQWCHHRVLIRCDNIMAVVAVWAAQSSIDQLIMHILCCLHFVCAYFEIDLLIEHIRGCENVVADAVSRNILQVIHGEKSGLDRVSVVIPQALWQLLVTCRPDWLSAR